MSAFMILPGVAVAMTSWLALTSGLAAGTRAKDEEAL